MGTDRKKLVLDHVCDTDMCELPTDVLDNIFERLPIRDAARTSILSKNWRYIWSACPYLVFDQQFYEEVFAKKPDAAYMYANVIEKVLLLHKGPVLCFDLYIPELYYYPWGEAIDKWLLFLSKNGIQELSLDYKYPSRYKLPSCVFSSPNLISLRLIDVIFNPPVGFSGFPKLVKLYLENITFAACETSEVTPVAPLLKDLELVSCIGVENFTIFAPQAFNLTVFDSTEVTQIFFDNFPNSVFICIMIEEQKGCPLNFYELHGKYPAVTELYFDGRYLKVSSATSIQRRLSFMSLYEVGVNSLSFDDLDQISCLFWLLKSSPNIENFEASASSVSPSESNVIEAVLAHLESPNCLGKMLSLQTVKLYFNEVSKLELAFIKCILAHSPNLECMHIDYKFVSWDKRLEISNELMRLPKASNKATLMVL